MERDYSKLMDLLTQLEGLSGYLSAEEKKEKIKLDNSYSSEKRSFVYKILKHSRDPEEAQSSVNSDIAEMSGLSEEGWTSTYEKLRSDLIASIEIDSRKPPWLRTLRYLSPVLIGVTLLILYFGMYFYSITPITAELESRIGLEQRAAAYEKTLRYDDLMSARVRKGGLFKSILLWPIEPSDQEVRGAAEFVGIVLAGNAFLVEGGSSCRAVEQSGSEDLSSDQLQYVGKVADAVQEKTLRWSEPPTLTLLEVMQAPPLC